MGSAMGGETISGAAAPQCFARASARRRPLVCQPRRPEVESADVTMDCGLTVGCRLVTESGERVMEVEEEEEEILSDADKISPSA